MAKDFECSARTEYFCQSDAQLLGWTVWKSDTHIFFSNAVRKASIFGRSGGVSDPPGRRREPAGGPLTPSLLLMAQPWRRQRPPPQYAQGWADNTTTISIVSTSLKPAVGGTCTDQETQKQAGIKHEGAEGAFEGWPLRRPPGPGRQ